MTFPSVVATTSGNSGSLTTSHGITLPAGSSGELILLVFVMQGESAPASLGDLTQLFSRGSGTSSQLTLSVWYKSATTNTTESINYTSGGMVPSAWTAYRISNWNDTAPIFYASAADSSGTAPQPPTNSTATAKDYLWIAETAWNGTGTLSGYPYASDQVASQWNNVDGVAAASCTKQLNANSDSPGSFTVSASPEWVAGTIAIEGSSSGTSGSANITEGEDTCSASGQYADPGTANITERSDSTGLPEGRDFVVASGSYGPYWNALEFSDTCAAYGAILPESNPDEQADTCAATGFADTHTQEVADTLIASGTVRNQCAITKVWFAGEWLIGIPKVYANGTWENVPGVKVYNGTTWVGCN